MNPYTLFPLNAQRASAITGPIGAVANFAGAIAGAITRESERLSKCQFAIEAAMRADAMLEVGDLDGYGVYNRRRCRRSDHDRQFRSGTSVITRA